MINTLAQPSNHWMSQKHGEWERAITLLSQREDQEMDNLYVELGKHASNLCPRNERTTHHVLAMAQP